MDPGRHRRSSPGAGRRSSVLDERMLERDRLGPQAARRTRAAPRRRSSAKCADLGPPGRPSWVSESTTRRRQLDAAHTAAGAWASHRRRRGDRSQFGDGVAPPRPRPQSARRSGGGRRLAARLLLHRGPRCGRRVPRRSVRSGQSIRFAQRVRRGARRWYRALGGPVRAPRLRASPSSSRARERAAARRPCSADVRDGPAGTRARGVVAVIVAPPAAGVRRGPPAGAGTNARERHPRGLVAPSLRQDVLDVVLHRALADHQRGGGDRPGCVAEARGRAGAARSSSRRGEATPPSRRVTPDRCAASPSPRRPSSRPTRELIQCTAALSSAAYVARGCGATPGAARTLPPASSAVAGPPPRPSRLVRQARPLVRRVPACRTPIVVAAENQRPRPRRTAQPRPARQRRRAWRAPAVGHRHHRCDVGAGHLVLQQRVLEADPSSSPQRGESGVPAAA